MSLTAPMIAENVEFPKAILGGNLIQFCDPTHYFVSSTMLSAGVPASLLIAEILWSGVTL
jgi:hypothetical protein